MCRIWLTVALLAVVVAAGSLKCVYGEGGSDFIPALNVGDKWQVEVRWTMSYKGIVARPDPPPDTEETETVKYEVIEEKQVDDAQGRTLTVYVIRISGVDVGGGYADILVRKDTFTLVRWYIVNRHGKQYNKHDNKPSDATFTSTVQVGKYTSTVWIDFPRFPTEAKSKTSKLKFHGDDKPGYVVTQETRFTGDVMEITITAKFKEGSQSKVYIKWEKGKKWWSESARWELDKDGKEVKYSRYTAKLVETP